MLSLKAVPHLSHLMSLSKPIDEYPYCTEGGMQLGE